MNSLLVSSVRLTRAGHADLQRGMLGWVSFLLGLGGLIKVDGVGLHRGGDGRYALSFPERRGRHGRRFAVICPTTDAARRAIERQVFQALGLEGWE